MLVLSRKHRESVVIVGRWSSSPDEGHGLGIKGASVKLGFEVDAMYLSIGRRCGNESTKTSGWKASQAG